MTYIATVSEPSAENEVVEKDTAMDKNLLNDLCNRSKEAFYEMHSAVADVDERQSKVREARFTGGGK